ncbi:MAG TPA: electron transfer flavoprotein subunit beta [Clostridiales bacterium UBA8153]|nr:electron transfer flavoprotein subunit beta [Clostridiales bacterium UBA8153]
MRFLVCIKQVPETTEAKINPKTGTLIREGIPSIINPFDMYALEEGIRLRDRLGGEVVVMSMGPPQAQAAVKEAIALGVDRGILLSDPAFAGADTLATAYTLAKGVEKLGGADLIICGKQASDGDTAQVGPGLAEELDLPHATYVRKISAITAGEITVERLVEGGIEVLRMPLPALLTVVKEINEPRLPSLKGVMRAKRAEVPTWGQAELGTDPARTGITGSPTQVVQVFTPELRRQGELLAGTAAEQAAVLIERLRAAAMI